MKLNFIILYFDTYFFILFYVFFSVLICLILIVLSLCLRFVGIVKPDLELLSIYECGFLPFDRSRLKFEVKFFVVAILFVLFDLEVMFILPWATSLNFFDLFSFLFMIFFIFVLFLTFIYELSENALEF